ncbi:MAG TPA: hypothetical protein VGW10_17735 [Solirubrobacteraceae bacterium]|nr:hypothetical protein [Solirubrobacteraceae bacterium]
MSEAQLQLDVEPRLGAEGRRPARLGRRALAVWAADRGPAHDDRPGATVVADRQVAPVRHQRVAVRPEHAAEVRGVLDRRVEVDVVADVDRQRHLGAGERRQRALVPSLVDRLAQLLPRGVPRRAPERDEGVEGRLLEHVGRHRGQAERAEVDRVVAEPHRRPPAHDPVGQVVDAEAVVRHGRALRGSRAR